MYENHALIAANEDLPFNAQAILDFILVGTNLKMAFAKVGGQNTFVILPVDKKPSGGMTISKMVTEINNLIQGYDPSQPDVLDVEAVAGAVSDVSKAANTKPSQDTNAPNIDYKNINVALRQAFLLLSTGKPTEYALEIDVDLTDLFPKDQSFINVGKLSLSVWNTKRDSIISRMNIVDIQKLLNQPAQ